MKDTSKKSINVDDKVVAQGKVWDKESLQKYRDYQAQYNKDSYRSFVCRFSRSKDAALIAFLEQSDNATDVIRQLLTALCEQNGWMETYEKQEELRRQILELSTTQQGHKSPEEMIKDGYQIPKALLEQEAYLKAKEEQDRKDNEEGEN